MFLTFALTELALCLFMPQNRLPNPAHALSSQGPTGTMALKELSPPAEPVDSSELLHELHTVCAAENGGILFGTWGPWQTHTVF